MDQAHQWLRRLSLLLLASHADAFALPLRFVCEPPHGKRVEQGGVGKGTDWIDESLENVHPAVTVDGESLTVTWGSTIKSVEGSGSAETDDIRFCCGVS